MQNKICPSCKELKSADFFRPNRKRRDGLQVYCLVCDKKRQAEHYLKNKDKYKKKAHNTGIANAKWWKEYKKTLKCNRCDEDHPACLQFHHTNPQEKEFAVSQVIRRWGRTKIFAEIAKCEVLCANCHAKEHYKE